MQFEIRPRVPCCGSIESSWGLGGIDLVFHVGGACRTMRAQPMQSEAYDGAGYVGLSPPISVTVANESSGSISEAAL